MCQELSQRGPAIGSAGNVMTVNVANEELGGKVEAVTQWGERVPKGLYDTVAADKGDNGIINNDIFGVKGRGYLSWQREYRGQIYENLGQITGW